MGIKIRKMKSRIPQFAVVLSAVLNMLIQTSWARLGETLEQCEARYGSAEPLTTPETILATGVKAYEFIREPYAIVALIGDRLGAIQVCYYKAGKFSTSEVVDLIQRNTSDSTIPEADGPFNPEWGFMRQTYSISGQYHVAAECNVGKNYSRLTVEDYLKMDRQSGGSGPALSSYSEKFADGYHKRLESGASDAAAESVNTANDGL